MARKFSSARCMASAVKRIRDLVRLRAVCGTRVDGGQPLSSWTVERDGGLLQTTWRCCISCASLLGSSDAQTVAKRGCCLGKAYLAVVWGNSGGSRIRDEVTSTGNTPPVSGAAIIPFGRAVRSWLFVSATWAGGYSSVPVDGASSLKITQF